MAADYLVGRGRPPAEWRFQKGQSGNPQGRPRKIQADSFLSSSHDQSRSQALNKPVTIVENGIKRKVPAKEAIATRQTAKALSGDRLTAKQLLDQDAAWEINRRGEAAERYAYWRDWLRNTPPVALHWPPGDSHPTYPHPRDVYLDPVRKSVTFLGPMEAEEASIFRNLVIERDVALCRAELASRCKADVPPEEDSSLGCAIVLHELLIPSLGGIRPDESIDLMIHRLTGAMIAIAVLSTASIKAKILQLERLLDRRAEPADWSAARSRQAGALMDLLAPPKRGRAMQQ